MSRPNQAIWSVLAALLLLVFGPTVVALESPTDPIDALVLIGAPEGPRLSGQPLALETDRVSAKMRCPVCQGLSVNDSPSESARAMKEEIRELLAEGYSEEQVLEYFERSYGEFVRLLPKAEGLNLLVWIAPVVVLIVGFWVVSKQLRRSTRAEPTEGQSADIQARHPAQAETQEDELDDYRRRIREALEEDLET